MKPDRYNKLALDGRDVTEVHVTEMTRLAQRALGLTEDGKCGPATRAALEALRSDSPVTVRPEVEPLTITTSGWLQGERVERIPAHASWCYPRLSTPSGWPVAIVAHYTATKPGTARGMAWKRTSVRESYERAASWHVTIDQDGTIVQMLPFNAGAWHCSRPIPGVGPANRHSVGIELVGYGDAFPRTQVDVAAQVWRAIVQTYGISRELAMLQHSELDPSRRKDPGPVWMAEHAPRVLSAAFAE